MPEDQTWWLVSPFITIADVHLSILLYRLWLLGFENRMWERTRPNIEKYFSRIRKVESFKKATSMSEGFAPLLEFLQNPYAWAVLGGAAGLLGLYYLTTKSKIGEQGLFEWLFGGCGCPVHGKAPIAPVIAAAPTPARAIHHGKCS